MHTQHAAALGAALESCGKAPRMHAHGFKPRSAVDSRIGRSLMWQVHVRCWAGSGVTVLGDREGPKKAPPVCMGSICGSAGEGRPRVPNRSDAWACDLHVTRAVVVEVGRSCVGLGGAGSAGSPRGVAEGRPVVHPVRASGPYHKIILYASALRGPSASRRSASSRGYTAYAARGVSRVVLRYLSAVLGRFHLCSALCSRYSLGRGGQIMLAQPPQTPHQASRVASRCARAGTQTMATPPHRITTLHSLQHARPPARPCNGILSS